MTSIHSHRIQFQSTNDRGGGGLRDQTLHRRIASKQRQELARRQVILGQRISSFYQNAELQNEPDFSSWKVERGGGKGRRGEEGGEEEEGRGKREGGGGQLVRIHMQK